MQRWEEGPSRDKSCFFDLGSWMFKRKAFQPTPQWLRNSSFYSGGLSAEMWKPSEKNIPPPLRISTRRDPEDLQTRTESYFQDVFPQRASVGKKPKRIYRCSSLKMGVNCNVGRDVGTWSFTSARLGYTYKVLLKLSFSQNVSEPQQKNWRYGWHEAF